MAWQDVMDFLNPFQVTTGVANSPTFDSSVFGPSVVGDPNKVAAIHAMQALNQNNGGQNFTAPEIKGLVAAQGQLNGPNSSPVDSPTAGLDNPISTATNWWASAGASFTSNPVSDWIAGLGDDFKGIADNGFGPFKGGDFVMVLVILVVLVIFLGVIRK